MIDLGSVALQLASRSIAVFPLSPGSKMPQPGSHGCLEATTNADVIREHWNRTPDANIGIATGARSGIWVLDIDPLHKGDESLAEVVSRHGELPQYRLSPHPLWWAPYVVEMAF